METQLKKGDNIRVKDNLMDELIRIGFEKNDMIPFVNEYKGKKFKVMDVWEDWGAGFNGITLNTGKKECFVTVDLCVEIPINACEKL